MKKRVQMRQMVLVVGTIAVTQFAFATEGGGGAYPNGNENYMLGALPPPGVHFLGFASTYHADQLRGADGNRLPVDFNLQVTALAPRVVWVTNQQILGGQVVLHAIAPLLNIDATVGGHSQNKTGLGDMLFGTGLGYHVSDKFHYVLGLDVVAPTGSYDKNNLVNLGRHYWTVEPLVAITYVQPSGINADIKLMVDVNTRNNDTNYKSGHEIHADYAVGWGFGNGWVAGVGGYVYKQVNDDQLNGVDIGNRGRAVAFGPSIKYDNGKGWFITAKWQKEFSVVNRAQGNEFKVKAVLPF